MLRLLPLICLVSAAPQSPAFTEFFNDFPEARALVGPSGRTFTGTLWQTARGNLARAPAAAAVVGPPAVLAVPALTVDGTAEFTQHLFSGSDSQYTIWLRGNNLGGTNVEVGLATDCAGTGFTRLARVVAPIFMLNGFYIKGTSFTFNVDGTNGRTRLNTQRLVVRNGVQTVIGCTVNLLA